MTRMKKYLSIAIICFAVLVGQRINVKWNEYTLEHSKLTVQNIEVLANGEDQELHCALPGSLDCPKEDTKVKYIL